MITKELIGIRGILLESANPLTKLMPILKPVNEPGPILTTIQSKSFTAILYLSRIFLVLTASSSEWVKELFESIESIVR